MGAYESALLQRYFELEEAGKALRDANLRSYAGEARALEVVEAWRKFRGALDRLEELKESRLGQSKTVLPGKRG